MDLANDDQPRQKTAPAESFLGRVDTLLDWTALEGVAADRRANAVPVFALKIALLKDWYGLSDSEAQARMLDRLSFRAFLGFAGDGSPDDVGILNELNYGTWARGPAMAGAIIDVEHQLREHGFAVRCGEMREPSLMPRTEGGGESAEARVTNLFDPGELGRMLEAVTEKAHAQGIAPGAHSVGIEQGAEGGEAPRPAASIALDDPRRIRAVLEWPWGKRSELTEHLNIGRDYGFSPLAKELSPYTHVSRRHAELLVYGEGVWVRDLGSRNGTFVNDDEVPKGQACLIDADSVVRFGPALKVALKIYD